MKLDLLQELKKIIFNSFITIITVVYFTLAFIPCLFLPSHKKQRYCLRPLIRFTLYLLKIFYGVKMEISGYEHIQELITHNKNFIIAPKHQSALDIYIMILIFNAPIFVCKKELLKIPLLGFYITSSKMLVIDRDGGASALRKILKHAKQTFKQYRPLIIFPEGERVKVGESVAYKPGVEAIYKHFKYPVIPIAYNSASVWSHGYLFQKATSKVLKVSILPPIPPDMRGDKFIDTLKGNIEDEMERIDANMHVC